MNRRRLFGVAGGLAVGAGIGAPLLSGVHGATSTGVLMRSRVPLPAPFTRPLPVPPTLAPQRITADTDYYDITQQSATVELLPGIRTEIWGYDGMFPGPTIVSRSGRRTVVQHRNHLPVPVVVHLHGGRTRAVDDGYPTDLIAPGATRQYTYPLRQPAATLWYHDHRMDFTGPAVWRGLAGFHLIRDDLEDTLSLPHGERELPLMIVDRAFDADGQLTYPARPDGSGGARDPYGAGLLGDVVLVNGAAWPFAEVAAVRYRLRLLNASNARRYRLALDPPPPGGGGLVQIGADGGLLDHPIAHDAIDLAPAERFDVVVDFGRYRPGQQVTLANRYGNGPTAQVMRFRIGTRTADDSRIPPQLASTPEVGPPTVTRTLRFQQRTVGGMPCWAINGEVFDPQRPQLTVPLGAIERWRLVSDLHHPVHVHLVHCHIVNRGISGPGAYDHGPKDTIDLRPAEEVTMISRFEGYPGRYLVHCHNLEHEDMGMMINLLVT